MIKLKCNETCDMDPSLRGALLVASRRHPCSLPGETNGYTQNTTALAAVLLDLDSRETHATRLARDLQIAIALGMFGARSRWCGGIKSMYSRGGRGS